MANAGPLGPGFGMDNNPMPPVAARGTAFRGKPPPVIPIAPKGRGAPAFRGRGRGFDTGKWTS